MTALSLREIGRRDDLPARRAAAACLPLAPRACYQRTWPRAQKGRPCSRSLIQAACDGGGRRYCAGSRKSSDAKALKCSLLSSDGGDAGADGGGESGELSTPIMNGSSAASRHLLTKLRMVGK